MNALILSTFIKQLDECLEDISNTYTEDSRFLKCKLYFNTIKHSNPRILITTWKTMINDKYRDQIDAGDVNYFIEKDYKEDAPEHYNSTVDNAIHDLRIMIRKMTPENTITSMKYIQNLCKLGDLYTL